MIIKNIESKITKYKTYLAFNEKSPATIDKYVRDIRKFFDYLGETKNKPICKQQLVSYKNFLLKTYKPTSVNSYIISINKFLIWCGAADVRIKTVRVQRAGSLNTVFSCSEYRILLEAARKQGLTRLYYLMRTLASTGMRISELRYLTVEALAEGSMIVINKAKAREIILPEGLCYELQHYSVFEGIKTGLVFRRKKAPDKFLDTTCVWRELQRLAQTAGIHPQKVHAQNFRHFFAKEYLGKYNDIIELADILGHSSIETTRIYTRTSCQEKRKRIAALGL